MIEKFQTIADFCKNLDTYINDTSNNYFLYAVQKETEVSYGNNNDCDLDYCQEHNIPVYNMGRDAGCIVHAKGNCGMAIFYNHSFYPGWLGYKFIQDFSDYLKSKNIENEIVHNDLLIDGYKVASIGEINIGENFERTYSAIQISINQDLDLIEHVCKKPMVKEPKGLSEYGITTKMVETFIKNWAKEMNF